MNQPLSETPIQMDRVIAVGFGAAGVTKDGESVYDEQQVDDDSYWTIEDAEKAAQADPDHDWRIFFFAPLYEATYQRQGQGRWMLIEKGRGFA